MHIFSHHPDNIRICDTIFFVDTLKNLDSSLAKAYPQPVDGITLSQKILKEDCKINWKNSAENIFVETLTKIWSDREE